MGAFVLIPKKVTLRTEPAKASVHYNGNILCSETPCELSLNRVVPKELIVEHPQYIPYVIYLAPLGDGWDAIFSAPIKLDLIVNPDDVAKALEKCRAERAQIADQDNVDAQACYRVPPYMPRLAMASGHCYVVFDIEVTGKPSNVRVTRCTDGIFRGASIKAVENWVYLPAQKNGALIVREGVETKMSFKLTDEFGRLIPEPEAGTDAR